MHYSAAIHVDQANAPDAQSAAAATFHDIADMIEGGAVMLIEVTASSEDGETCTTTWLVDVDGADHG